MSVSPRSFLMAGAASAALWGALLAAAPARADDATPAQASTMEAQIRDAIGSLLGPAITLPARPIQVTAAGDHYDVVFPIIGVTTNPGVNGAPPTQGQPLQITGSAKQGANGIWTVDNVQVSSPITFTIPMPIAPPDGGPVHNVPVTYALAQQGQQGRIVWDPTLATTSSWTASTTSSTIHALGPDVRQDSTVGPTSATTTLKPAGPGHVDLLLEGDAKDYIIDGSQSANPVSVALKHLTFSSAMTGVNNASAVKLIQAMATIAASSLPSPGGPGAVPPVPGTPLADKISPEMVKTMLAAMRDFATSFAIDEAAEGFAFNVQGQNVTLDKLRIEFDTKSDAGLLHAGLTMDFEGLGLPDIPLGAMADLIPTKVEFRPVIGGVAAADLFSLANLASENRDPAPADIQALFSHGGITSGIESMTILVGGAAFTGHTTAVMTSPSPGDITASGQIVAENFDVLMQKVGTIPPIAQQGQAALVFVKGIGKTVDNKLVWDFSYKAGRLLVNNVDLTAMAGMGAPGTPAPPRAVPQASPPTPAPRRPMVPGQVPSWAK